VLDLRILKALQMMCSAGNTLRNAGQFALV
jgi:hypothetical protein